MNKLKLFSIFNQGSRTYFYSSIFFPRGIRQEVFILYGFVRTADNLVDCVPQKNKEFKEYVKLTWQAWDGSLSGHQEIDLFIDQCKRLGFDKKWVKSFLDAMEMDLLKNRYQTLDETLTYMYGSAEVIGLMMAKILELSEKSYQSAAMLGRAMQYANFIRDFVEDINMNRLYFPFNDLCVTEIDIKNLDQITQRQDFSKFLRCQINKFEEWQNKAEKGFVYIPKRYLIPIKTASDMYKWTVKEIKKNPLIVVKTKVKPSVIRILWTIIKNTIMIK